MLAEIEAKVEEVQAHRKRTLGVLAAMGHAVPGAPPPDSRSSSRSTRSGAGEGAVERESEAVKAALEELEGHCGSVPHAEYLLAAKAQALLRLGR